RPPPEQAEAQARAEPLDRARPDLHSAPTATRDEAARYEKPAPAKGAEPPPVVDPKPGLELRAARGGLQARWWLPAHDIDRTRRLAGESAVLTARLVVVAPDAVDVVRRIELDRSPVGAEGEWWLEAPARPGRATLAIGLLDNQGFRSVMHSETLRLEAPDAPAEAEPKP